VCPNDDARVWNGWWVEAEGTAYFRRFEGSTGATLDDVVVPNYQPGNSWGYGPYGGAVDAEGNLWVTGLLGPLMRIDAVALTYERWDVPPDAGPYGMGVDANGHPWMVGLESGAITHFDPNAETFDVYPTPNGSLRGMMIDRNGHLWAAGNAPCGLVQFDTAAGLIINAAVPLPGCVTPVGVSIDVDGFVWAPDQGANVAFKVDPITYMSTSTAGLVQPYTYSDMTGAGLGLVVNPPQG
jgi:streptogramin lyase